MVEWVVRKEDFMKASEMLNLLAKQWCTLRDLMKIGHIGRNKALMIKNEIKTKLNKQGYIIPYNVVPMKEVVNYLNIDIDYLEKMKQYED